MKHTSEPWSWEQTEEVETGLDVFIQQVGWTYTQANAKRIVACVNRL